ncbi:MAG: transporter [Desulfamplus sp.]|nr:transporter [Desulfamplus sp.]
MAMVFTSPPKAGHAYDLPSVNLGFTSFLDGGPPAGPGIYFAQYLQYWQSESFTNTKGDPALPGFAREELSAWISLTQFLYQSDQEVFLGGKWGIDVIVPVVSIDMSYGTDNPAFPQDNGSGVGDILIGPYLQWDPVMGKRGPLFMHRMEFQMIFPTGAYDADKELNAGSNFFSFNPYWAGTLFLTPQLTATTRIHYLWNAENDEPNRGFRNLGAKETRAGQAVHANFAMAYELIPGKMRLGINGYWLQQISDTEMDGEDIPDRKEQVLGIGPGMVYHFSQNDHLFFNAYFESSAENRPEGERFNVRWVHHF